MKGETTRLDVSTRGAVVQTRILIYLRAGPVPTGPVLLSSSISCLIEPINTLILKVLPGLRLFLLVPITIWGTLKGLGERVARPWKVHPFQGCEHRSWKKQGSTSPLSSLPWRIRPPPNTRWIWCRVRICWYVGWRYVLTRSHSDWWNDAHAWERRSRRSLCTSGLLDEPLHTLPVRCTNLWLRYVRRHLPSCFPFPRFWEWTKDVPPCSLDLGTRSEGPGFCSFCHWFTCRREPIVCRKSREGVRGETFEAPWRMDRLTRSRRFVEEGPRGDLDQHCDLCCRRLGGQEH